MERSLKKYMYDATVVNDHDLYSDQQRFLIGIWQGSGYLLDLFIVFAYDEEEALEILCDYFERKGITRFFVDTSGMTAKEINDWEDSGGIYYVLGEYGHGHYIYGENLHIEVI